MTRNAERILKMIEASREHPTAESIFLHLKESGTPMSLATVYNQLKVLTENGHIRRLTFEGQPDRYDRTEPHDHMICIRCGALSDVHTRDLTSLLSEETGVTIHRYDLKLYHLCSSCRQQDA